MSRIQHNEIPAPNITITTRDAIRLAGLLEDGAAQRTGAGRMLVGKIQDARIVLPSDIKDRVVTMHSLVRYRDRAGQTFDALLVYPGEAAAGVENVSILSPLGIALLGLSEGRAAAYETEDGAHAVVTVVQVSLQPEASMLDVDEARVRARRYVRPRRAVDARRRRAIERYYG